jgi:predicted GNAT superfamily acetyltransferase
MQNLVIRDATPGDFETICALNLAEIQHTSAMDVDRLAALDELSCYHKIGCVAGSVAAFLLAMCNGAPYENDNNPLITKVAAMIANFDRSALDRNVRCIPPCNQRN